MDQVRLQCLTHERHLINRYGINIDTFVMALISYYSWLCLGLFPLLNCELLKSRDFFFFHFSLSSTFHGMWYVRYSVNGFSKAVTTKYVTLLSSVPDD